MRHANTITTPRQAAVYFDSKFKQMTSLGFFGFDHTQLFCFCFFLFLPLYFCTHSVVLVLCVSLFSTLPLDTLIIFRILSYLLAPPEVYSSPCLFYIPLYVPFHFTPFSLIHLCLPLFFLLLLAHARIALSSLLVFLSL